MDYGIPVLPATGGGIALTMLGLSRNNYIVLALGAILLAIVLFNHIKLRKNEDK